MRDSLGIFLINKKKCGLKKHQNNNHLEKITEIIMWI